MRAPSQGDPNQPLARVASLGRALRSPRFSLPTPRAALGMPGLCESGARPAVQNNATGTFVCLPFLRATTRGGVPAEKRACAPSLGGREAARVACLAVIVCVNAHRRELSLNGCAPAARPDPHTSPAFPNTAAAGAVEPIDVLPAAPRLNLSSTPAPREAAINSMLHGVRTRRTYIHTYARRVRRGFERARGASGEIDRAGPSGRLHRSPCCPATAALGGMPSDSWETAPPPPPPPRKRAPVKDAWDDDTSSGGEDAGGDDDDPQQVWDAANTTAPMPTLVAAPSSRVPVDALQP
ncbi:hypothetical protein PHLGIDRAFT_121854, partial [Phlebiopsis gigantea 11061_1 CR5-6]